MNDKPKINRLTNAERSKDIAALQTLTGRRYAGKINSRIIFVAGLLYDFNERDATLDDIAGKYQKCCVKYGVIAAKGWLYRDLLLTFAAKTSPAAKCLIKLSGLLGVIHFVISNASAFVAVVQKFFIK